MTAYPTWLSVVTLSWATTGALAQFEIGSYYPFTDATPRDYSGAADPTLPALRWSCILQHPGATYLAIHFVDFDLGPGDELIIDDGQDGQAYSLAGRGKMQAGTFWAQHIKGDTTRLRLLVTGIEGGCGFAIDQYAAGDVDFQSLPTPEDVSGPDDRHNAICYQHSHPTHYDRGRAVVRLLTDGNAFCTGSLVSPGNHVITNNHCIGTAAKALNTDFDFMAETPECDMENCPNCFTGVVFSGSRLIRNHGSLDYALVQIMEGDPATSFGYLEFENRLPILGEVIYIPQHPQGRAKLFAIFSTHPEDTGGLARINRLDASKCIAGQQQDIGYFADTNSGSSGSPVLAASSHKIIALHHCAGSPNTGVPIHEIYPQIQSDLLCLSPYGRPSAGAVAVYASSSAAGQEADKAIDSHLATRWASSASANPHWLQLDLGLHAPVTGFKVWHASSGGGATSQNTRVFRIESAASASGPWTTEFTGDNAAQASLNAFTYPSSKPLRHVRLWITDPGSDIVARIQELEVISEPTMVTGTPAGTNVAGESAEAQASSIFGGDHGPGKAIDGIVSVASKWVSSSAPPPHWLMLDLGAIRSVSGFVLRQPSAAGESTQFNATDFSFQSARSTSGPWYTEAHVRTSGTAVSEVRRFVAPKDLRYVRLCIDVPNSVLNDNHARVPEFEVIEFSGIVATFSAAPLAGTVPLAVQFTDASIGDVTSWSWSFGDGGASGLQHPLHTYMVPGQYTVSLTVNGADGPSTETRTNYISVDAVPPDFDFDGDVDQSDFGHLQNCYSGPGVPQDDSTCYNARLDDDGDVDLDDFGVLQGCMSGAGVPADPGCLP